jgi:hypothetical protein
LHEICPLLFQGIIGKQPGGQQVSIDKPWR